MSQVKSMNFDIRMDVRSFATIAKWMRDKVPSENSRCGIASSALELFIQLIPENERIKGTAEAIAYLETIGITKLQKKKGVSHALAEQIEKEKTELFRKLNKQATPTVSQDEMAFLTRRGIQND